MSANSFKLVLILTLALLGGCAKNFAVTSDVPKPLVEPIPAVALLELNEAFRNYQYIEDSDTRALETVDFGAAQVGLFEQIFGTLFTLASSIDEPLDLKIEPEILDFQYSVPAETKLKLYEIWVKYRLRITDREDKEVADWVVKGYGKTPTSMLGSQVSAFNTASNVALRDVGAQLAIGFRTQPAIEEFLANLGGNASSAVPSELGDQTPDPMLDASPDKPVEDPVTTPAAEPVDDELPDATSLELVAADRSQQAEHESLREGEE